MKPASNLITHTMKKKTKSRVFISKIHNPSTGIYMFWYQVHRNKRVIKKGSQEQMAKLKLELIEKYKNENIKLGS